MNADQRTAVYDGADPVGFALSKNKHRRNMMRAALALIVAKLAKLPRGRPLEINPISSRTSSRMLAAQIEVHEETIQLAREINERAASNVIVMVYARAPACRRGHGDGNARPPGVGRRLGVTLIHEASGVQARARRPVTVVATAFSLPGLARQISKKGRGAFVSMCELLVLFTVVLTCWMMFSSHSDALRASFRLLASNSTVCRNQ